MIWLVPPLLMVLYRGHEWETSARPHLAMVLSSEGGVDVGVV
jgi:hypothetical protein